MKQGTRYRATDADRDFVRRAVMAGTSIETIASCLNMHDDTLRKHYRYELQVSREILKNKSVGVVVDALDAGSLDAAKFVLARVAGWAERQELSGPNKGPVEVRNLTAADELKAFLNKSVPDEKPS